MLPIQEDAAEFPEIVDSACKLHSCDTGGMAKAKKRLYHGDG